MSEIRFYHLQSQSLDNALPALLSKAREKGRIVVKTKDSKEAERLNEVLWTYDPNAFLAHGTSKDGHSGDQPIYLTPDDENPNGANILVLTGGASSDKLGDFNLCCEIFDGRNQDAVAEARSRWKTYKDAGHTVTYLQQNDRGGWETKS